MLHFNPNDRSKLLAYPTEISCRAIAKKSGDEDSLARIAFRIGTAFARLSNIGVSSFFDDFEDSYLRYTR